MATITRQLLVERLMEYERREQQALADANAAHGAQVALRGLLEIVDLEIVDLPVEGAATE